MEQGPGFGACEVHAGGAGAAPVADWRQETQSSRCRSLNRLLAQPLACKRRGGSEHDGWDACAACRRCLRCGLLRAASGVAAGADAGCTADSLRFAFSRASPATCERKNSSSRSSRSTASRNALVRIPAAVPDRKDNNPQHNDQEIFHKGNWRGLYEVAEAALQRTLLRVPASSLSSAFTPSDRRPLSTGSATPPGSRIRQRPGRKPSMHSGRDESASHARRQTLMPRSSEFRAVDSRAAPFHWLNKPS